MDKITIMAIRTLPKRYVRDGTRVCYVTSPNGTTRCYAINPELLPIHCVAGKWKWSKMKFIAPADETTSPRTEALVTNG